MRTLNSVREKIVAVVQDDCGASSGARKTGKSEFAENLFAGNVLFFGNVDRYDVLKAFAAEVCARASVSTVRTRADISLDIHFSGTATSAIQKMPVFALAASEGRAYVSFSSRRFSHCPPVSPVRASAPGDEHWDPQFGPVGGNDLLSAITIFRGPGSIPVAT